MILRGTNRTRQSGIALIVTLILVVLLAGLAVALLQTSGLERGTSKSVADKAKADLIAQTAANAAIAALVDNLKQYPDSATSWETINGNEGTVLYYHDQTPEHATNSGTSAQLFVLPLASGATAQTLANKTSALPTLSDSPASTANAYNFNHARSHGDLQGWIGSSPQWAATTPAAPQPFRGQWINITDSSSKVTGRYAFWMEDESFKANANLMGSTARGSNTLGNLPAQIPFQGILKTILPANSDYDGIAGSITGYRANFPSSLFFNYRDLNQVTGQSTLADTAKFETTIYSGTSNLSRAGSKRVNLNGVVSTTNDAAAIRKQLDQIINTITYHLPNFAQRFYRNGSDKNSLDVASSGSPSNQIIYLNKIAANIRDYIDTDSQPTVINSDLSVRIGPPPPGATWTTPPTHSVPAGGASGSNEVIAIGKDAVPFIQEYMLRVKQIAPTLRPVATANYNIQIDHYVEFWNMTDKDISVANLGPNPFLRIANQFAWTSYGGNDIPEDKARDFSIPLNVFTNASGASLVFAAGTATVLTTDPASLPSGFTGIDSSKIFRPPASTPADSYRIYTGICNRKNSSSHPHLDAQPRPGGSDPSTTADLETEIILGNDNGVLESFGAPAVYYITVNADDGTQTTPTVRTDQTKYYFRASSLKGNKTASTVSQTGDPRTNNEQLALTTSVANDDQTAYKLEITDLSPGSFPNATFTALDSNYVDSTLWTDVAANSADAAHAPAVIANSALTSIAQMGDIFDPVRSKGVSGDITLSRGGGRTFKIGQPETYDASLNTSGLWDGDSNSASREWTAWRLTDVFTTIDTVQLDGRININGVNRDNGAALRTALYGYDFQATPDSDPTIASTALTDPEITALIGQMQARLANQSPFASTVGPFAERGELSEMPVFNTGTQLTGQNMATVYDRGREELFRRLAELITTRGNIFTVYAVGQTLVPPTGTATTPIVTSTAQLKVTFRVDPVWSSGTPTDPNWDPTTTARFNKPDSYAIKILYSGD